MKPIIRTFSIGASPRTVRDDSAMLRGFALHVHMATGDEERKNGIIRSFNVRSVARCHAPEQSPYLLRSFVAITAPPDNPQEPLIVRHPAKGS